MWTCLLTLFILHVRGRNMPPFNTEQNEHIQRKSDCVIRSQIQRHLLEPRRGPRAFRLGGGSEKIQKMSLLPKYQLKEFI